MVCFNYISKVIIKNLINLCLKVLNKTKEINKLRELEGLREIYNNYDTFIIDLWGVMHNGIMLNPRAIETVENSVTSKICFCLMRQDQE